MMDIDELQRIAADWLKGQGIPKPTVQWVRFVDVPGQLGEVSWHAGSAPVISLKHGLDDDKTLRVLAHETAHLILKHIRPVHFRRLARPLVSAADYRSANDAQRHQDMESSAERLASLMVANYLMERIIRQLQEHRT